MLIATVLAIKTRVEILLAELRNVRETDLHLDSARKTVPFKEIRLLLRDARWLNSIPALVRSI